MKTIMQFIVITIQKLQIWHLKWNIIFISFLRHSNVGLCGQNKNKTDDYSCLVDLVSHREFNVIFHQLSIAAAAAFLRYNLLQYWFIYYFKRPSKSNQIYLSKSI